MWKYSRDACSIDWEGKLEGDSGSGSKLEGDSGSGSKLEGDSGSGSKLEGDSGSKLEGVLILGTKISLHEYCMWKCEISACFSTRCHSLGVNLKVTLTANLKLPSSWALDVTHQWHLQ